ncbi:restriction endonuclease fold toxin-2 domain-containing protein [Streptomyces sp. NPDC059874]|uniref:restriction endonuclease fold toxin-2 domain-containing protein n=1 Tax=Streptomyces sp. NPDC059874 TaxID=3346983 RepID=UPI0036566A86
MPTWALTRRNSAIPPPAQLAVTCSLPADGSRPRRFRGCGHASSPWSWSCRHCTCSTAVAVSPFGKKCYRSLEELRANHQTGKKEFLFDPDRNELQKYAAALNDPRNTEMRGVETVTNDPDSVAYWRVMMAAYGVKGYARYVP